MKYFPWEMLRVVHSNRMPSLLTECHCFLSLPSLFLGCEYGSVQPGLFVQYSGSNLFLGSAWAALTGCGFPVSRCQPWIPARHSRDPSSQAHLSCTLSCLRLETTAEDIVWACRDTSSSPKQRALHWNTRSSECHFPTNTYIGETSL